MEDCGSCRFWKQLGESSTGECRRNAPQAVGFMPHPQMVGGGVKGPEARWPLTRADDFCGEFKSNE